MRGYGRRLAAQLPQGRLLPDAVWRRRHHSITVLLWLHVPALLAFAIVRGYGVLHATSEMLLVISLAVAASLPRLGRGARSAAAALGLVACSALLIHFWEGQSEGHFHFFVVVSLLILYQDWLPFLIAVGFVVVHHGVLGSAMAGTVYGSEAAAAQPWSWALIHGSFILAASAANIVSWRATEQLLRDPLTGLAGRAIMFDRLRLGLRRAHRRGLHAGAIFLDLDRFKVLNDSLGHAAGDRVLVTASERLREAVRANDTAVRFGGDEFVIVCEDLRDSDEAVGVAERLIAALREPYVVEAHEVVLTVSLGIAVGGRGDDRRAEDLIRDADAAMYRAKENGKDRYVVFGEEMRTARSRASPTISICATRCAAASCTCATSRSSRWAAVACGRSRRSCTGSIRPAACWRRATSWRSPRRRGWSSRSASGRSARPAASSRAGAEPTRPPASSCR